MIQMPFRWKQSAVRVTIHVFFFLTVELDQILKYHLYLFDSCCNIFFSFNLQTFLFPYSRKIACFLFRNVCVVLCTYIGFVNFVLRYRIRLFTKTITIKIIFWWKWIIKGADIVSVEEEVQPTIGEHISFAAGHLASMICKHSYVISNIMMMVSSMRRRKETLFENKYDFFLLH